MKPELQRILDAACSELCREIDVKSTPSFYQLMLSKKVLQAEQIDTCKEAGTKSEQMEKVLSVLKCRPDKCFDLFCEVLTEIERDDLVDKLLKPSSSETPLKPSSSETPLKPSSSETLLKPSSSAATPDQKKLPMSFDEAFDGKTVDLCRNINPRHGLLLELENRKVLTDVEKGSLDSLMAVQGDFQVNEKLLGMVKKRGAKDLPKFYSALIATGQTSVVEYIIGREPVKGEFDS